MGYPNSEREEDKETDKKMKAKTLHQDFRTVKNFSIHQKSWKHTCPETEKKSHSKSEDKISKNLHDTCKRKRKKKIIKFEVSLMFRIYFFGSTGKQVTEYLNNFEIVYMFISGVIRNEMLQNQPKHFLH